MVVIYEPVWNNDCKLPFSGLCATRNRRWRGQRGKTAIWLFGASSKSLSLPRGHSCHQKGPKPSIQEYAQLGELSIVQVIVGFTLAVARYSCRPFLRLGLNDQASNVLRRRREAGKRWILGPTWGKLRLTPHLQRIGGKEMDTLGPAWKTRRSEWLLIFIVYMEWTSIGNWSVAKNSFTFFWHFKNSLVCCQFCKTPLHVRRHIGNNIESAASRSFGCSTRSF